jgi:MtaA/CmuA family methyltransferase
MDRFQDALRGRPRDRAPIFPLVAAWAAANFASASPESLAQNPELIFDAQVKAQEAVGHDALFAYGHSLFIPQAFGCTVRFPETGPLADPPGYAPASLEDVAKLPVPHPEQAEPLSLNLRLVRLLGEYSRGRIPVLGLFEGPFTTTTRIIEAEIILRMIVRNQAVLHALLDRVTQFLILYGKALVQRGANVLFVPEPSSSSSMISPKMFRDFVLPRLKMVTEALSVPVILHICGDTGPMLEAMGESGASVLSLDQCMNLTASRKRLDRSVLGGNVEPTNALLMGTEEDVVRDTRKCLAAAGTDRFVLMSGCGVPPGAPVDNMKAMVHTAIDYGLG